MAYADYSFYQSRGGRMSLSEFSVYSEKASDYIDYITNDKSKAYVDTEDRLKKCCSVLCDEIKRLEKSDGIAYIFAEGDVDSNRIQQGEQQDENSH